ncbi:MAG: four helix bundle protein [bacterium]
MNCTGLPANCAVPHTLYPPTLPKAHRGILKKDYLHFLHIARGSLSETQYFLHLAHRLDYLSDASYTGLDTQVSETFRTLHGLIQAVKQEL